MSGENVEQRSKRRSTAGRNKLRRFNNIESVIVEEPFTLSMPHETPTSLKLEAGVKEGNLAGDGYYVSATNNSSRYYGLLVSKEALKAASLLHFQAESESLDLNRRMKFLKERHHATIQDDVNHTSAVAVATQSGPASKRRKIDDNQALAAGTRIVQKLKYVPGNDDTDPGYRLLIATYINVEAAAEGDTSKTEAIAKACENGGDFVGQYYFKYESPVGRLEAQKEKEKLTDEGLRISMGFQTFLQETPMPIWFPLSNLQISQHKVLSMLQMKRNSKGNVVWEETAAADLSNVQGTHVTMESRSHFRIGIVGGGIAGLACANELLRLGETEGIKLEVILLEGRSRLGGRLLTDDSTFKFADGSNFPVDLGASWIHGIDHNPLAELAKQAKIDFVTAGEDVKMLRGGLKPVDSTVDEYMGKLFDTLLDQAADDVWDSDDYTGEEKRKQKAVRWYAEGLVDNPAKVVTLRQQDAPSHRHSSDVSIDHAVGMAVAKHNHRVFRKFGDQEHSLLLWNTKNVEYALGANLSDLSMKFWDSDERHAFEGDHVLLKQGYSAVVRHLEKELERHGDKFKCETGFHVGKIEYARKSTTKSYPLELDSQIRRLVDLSDSCCVESKDGKRSLKFDFVVSTLPLGVLKESVEAESSSITRTEKAAVIFEPPLPIPKVDAIRNTGFGLLNKVYLQFPSAFWRTTGIFENEGQTLFGNASGLYPHHYMFNDIGISLGRKNDKPPVLMSLISGKEAVACELMDDQEIVKQVIAVLRKLFGDEMVPEPIAFKITRWGADTFSRGCYTFLPPGATDQDFQILQSPINGNGDSLILEGSETMRLFWAGEHTTALHPSMAHGALLSGLRAAEEIVSTICFKNEDRSGFEKMLPMAIFRMNNPTAKLQCSLCHLFGSRVREGSLLALQKGARQVLVHNNCGENSPEVEVRDGKWKDVIKAVNRGKQIKCCMCGLVGATIGCTDANCFRCFHFSCGEDTGWRFERDGKEYFCDLHRSYDDQEENACDLVSLKFYQSKRPDSEALRCCFCGKGDNDSRRGKMLAFSQAANLLIVHDCCARYTTIMETLDDYTALNDVQFKNLFEVQKHAKPCKSCTKGGATIVCSEVSCGSHYHFTCAEDDQGWNFLKRGANFKCHVHRKGDKKPDLPKCSAGATTHATVSPPAIPAGLFQHNLFLSGAERVNQSGQNGDTLRKAKAAIAVNDKIWERSTTQSTPPKKSTLEDTEESSDEDNEDVNIMLMPLTSGSPAEVGCRTLSLMRTSIDEPWCFELFLAPNYESEISVLQIQLTGGGRTDEIEEDVVMDVHSLNQSVVGSEGVRTLYEIMEFLRGTTTLDLIVRSTSC